MSTKQVNFKQLEINDIEQKVIELKINLVLYKIKQKTQQKFTPHIIKQAKHKIAQLLTLKTNYYKNIRCHKNKH